MRSGGERRRLEVQLLREVVTFQVFPLGMQIGSFLHCGWGLVRVADGSAVGYPWHTSYHPLGPEQLREVKLLKGGLIF